MKKVMSILTVAAFLIGAAAMVSFTVKEKSAEPTTAWFYMEDGIPNEAEGPQTEVSLDCLSNTPDVCAREYFVDSENPNEPIEPTYAPDKTGSRPL